jgi:hypothetical protein
MERFLYNTIRLLITICFLAGITLLFIKEPFKKYLAISVLLCFSISVFCLGLWAIFGTICRWKTFTESYKRIDFENYFGSIGRLIYIIIGMGAIGASFFFMYLFLNSILKR